MNKKDHRIIEKPWEYKIKTFHYDCSSVDYLEHYIDISFEKENIIRNLRFIAPRQLKIEEGFPQPTHGLEIIDISDRGLENVNVWVTDFEASNGAITFYSKDLIEIK